MKFNVADFFFLIPNIKFRENVLNASPDGQDGQA